MSVSGEEVSLNAMWGPVSVTSHDADSVCACTQLGVLHRDPRYLEATQPLTLDPQPACSLIAFLSITFSL